MEQKTSYKALIEDKVAVEHRAIGLMIQNFLIWFIPGVIVFAISLVILLVLLGGAATGVEINIYKWMPKGLVSFFGIAYLLTGITFVVLLFIIQELDAEGVISLLGATIMCWILAYVAIKMELQRLSKKETLN